jgi:eukaryotic-like serine/threonine-protein kinase
VSTPTAVAERYRLDERLGAGGMSTVFLGLDTVLERQVAVKLLAEHLAEDESFVARFRREALAAARLQHPNVVQVFDSGQDPSSNRHFIVMEYVDGPSCADLIREQGTLGVEQTADIVRGACNGLDYAHRQGVVHRDVKPGNLLISSDGDNLKLADFGIAKAAEQTRITQVGSVLGTAAYLSPEQARGEEAGPPSDIYSLGVCAYQFLAGRLPHEYGSLTELALKQQNDRVQPITDFRPEVPGELDRAVRVCLETDPSARYGSALELGEALTAGLRGEVTQATQMLESQTGATQALGSQTPAARPAGGQRVAAAPPAPAPAAAAPARQPPPAAPRRSRRWVGALIVGLLVLAVGALVALGLIQAAEDPGDDIPAIEAQDFEEQVNGLRDLIEQNTE